MLECSITARKFDSGYLHLRSLVQQSTGFKIEVTNSNANTVIVGVRVQVGSQGLERVPSYFEICGRSASARAVCLCLYLR